MSKYICCSDLHLRGTAPVFRRDNYVETMFKKFEFIVNYTNEKHADLLIAGDIFDTARVPHEVVNKAMDLLLQLEYPATICAGQHDMSYHNPDVFKSPLYSMYLAGVVKWQHNATIYSHDWDQEATIPTPTELSELLLIHKTITPREPPFFLKEAVSAEQAMDQFPNFEWIVSGDYHVPYITENDRGQILVNCGCMLRNAKDQKNHKPQIHLIDTEAGTYDSIVVPHKPYSEVFDLRLIDMSKKKNFKEALESLTVALAKNSNIGDFKDLVQHVAVLHSLDTNEMRLLNTVILEARI